MTNVCQAATETLCGCCAGVAVETPELITNRPALTAMSYRVGRYATFNASMLAMLSQSAYAPMSLLRTRDTSDFTIALLDAWAITLDVLTFYQERFANEAFLRTAIDQRSVFELARLVGYVPSPGVSASAVMAFTLSSAPGSPDNVLIPAGTRVQSVPGPGQSPQVFETSSDLTAVIAYNALPAQTTVAWALSPGDTSTWIHGTANKINVGDALLFVSASNGAASPTGPGEVHYVTAVELDSSSGATKITWDTGIGTSSTGFPSSPGATGASADEVSIVIFRKKAALYGVQAPNPNTIPSTTVVNVPPGTYGNDWDYDQYKSGSDQISLDAPYPGLQPQATPATGPTAGPTDWVVLTGLAYTSYFPIVAADEWNPNLYTLTQKTTRLTLGAGQILAGDKSLTLDQVLAAFTRETRSITAYVQSDVLTPADLPSTTWNGSPAHPLETDMPGPVNGTTVTVKGGQLIAGGQPVGVSGRRARLGVAPSANATFVPEGSTAQLTVADNQQFLIDAYPPSPSTAAGQSVWSVITISGVAGSLQIADASVQIVPAGAKDPIVGEAAVVSTVTVKGDLTTLGVTIPLARVYDATTVAVNANAVNATNGETVQEILGSGDATNESLQLTLKQSPLTYVTAATNNGAQSTLQVWVNNLQWHEVPNLLASGPADRVFVTRPNPPGNAVVQFGNGVEGGRTPTGQTNIRAVYRKGVGAAGMVNAGQLTQPLDRPQGVMSVTNPSAASGAADPASAADARASAPLPTLTLGRVVSLEDYRNYALAFAGIAKAIATWTCFSGTRGVFLTVAGENGAVLSANDPIVSKLWSSLNDLGNPYVPLQIAAYEPVLFQVGARVAIDQTDYDATQVLDPGLAEPGERVLLRAAPPRPASGGVRGRERHPGDARGRGAANPGAVPEREPLDDRPTSLVCVRSDATPGGPDAFARSRLTRKSWSLVVSLNAKQMYALLPAVYRARDAANGLPLQALFEVLATQSQLVEENIQQLYDDQFIETCSPWVIPYIGDLIGYNSIYEIATATDSRAEVANTIGYRRRKGTLIALEQVAMDVSGDAAMAVEEFKRLITTESMRHVRPHHAATVDLRQGVALDRLDSPFDTSNRTIDVRRVAPRARTVTDPDPAPLEIALHGPGRSNIPSVAVHLWRWQAWPVSNAPAVQVDARRYLFSPLGNDIPLFSKPAPRASFGSVTTRLDVPQPIRRREFARDIASFYGSYLVLYVDGAAVDASQIQCANLSDRPGGSWCAVPAGRIAIDPELGRIQLAADLPAPASLRVTYCYGFPAPIGGGPYDRTSSLDQLVPAEAAFFAVVGGAEFPTLASAVAQWNQVSASDSNVAGIIVLPSFERYAIDLTGANAVRLAPMSTLTIASAEPVPAGGARDVVWNNARVTLRGDIEVVGLPGAGDTAGQLLISGVWIAGQVSISGAAVGVQITDTTLVPGGGLKRDGAPLSHGEPSIVVTAEEATLCLTRSISGPIAAGSTAATRIYASIVDATSPCCVAYAGPDLTDAGGDLHVEDSTVVGKVHTRTMRLASNTIFAARPSRMDPWPAAVWCSRQQVGCVRFCSLPFDSITPRRYECLPRDAASEPAFEPSFITLRYGHPSYALLSGDVPVGVWRGADNGSQMGVYYQLQETEAVQNVQIRAPEYLPVTLEDGIFPHPRDRWPPGLLRPSSTAFKERAIAATNRTSASPRSSASASISFSCISLPTLPNEHRYSYERRLRPSPLQSK